jgi:hypothetical protein
MDRDKLRWGGGVRVLPLRGNFEAHSEVHIADSTVVGHLDDIIALGGPATQLSILRDVAPLSAT